VAVPAVVDAAGLEGVAPTRRTFHPLETEVLQHPVLKVEKLPVVPKQVVGVEEEDFAEQEAAGLWDRVC
jgi:hypothetical protein